MQHDQAAIKKTHKDEDKLDKIRAQIDKLQDLVQKARKKLDIFTSHIFWLKMTAPLPTDTHGLSQGAPYSHVESHLERREAHKQIGTMK